ncbi:hypothetical protein GCM10009332_24070 [Shewanella gelidii]|uniref:Uncharacterized protein n=1 Tax=Shewanella gelidii TaxID=1642821 RepID=A0A917JV28_9GAMM|nr:hypothetical protein GCM10009332_24070 [Shewanella gelidii]
MIYVVYTVTKAYSKADKAMAAALAPVNQAYHDLRHSMDGSHKVSAVGMDYYLSHYIDSDYRLDQGAYNIMYQVKENRPFLKKTLTWDLIVKPGYRHLIRQSNIGGS